MTYCTFFSVSISWTVYDRGYARNDIVNLFKFIDWIMTLPDELSQRVKETLGEALIVLGLHLNVDHDVKGFAIEIPDSHSGVTMAKVPVGLSKRPMNRKRAIRLPSTLS